MYSDGDRLRVIAEGSDKPPEEYRTPWRRDYARLIHSPAFRRLQGKTQVFPGHESDFYRNRLTHSLEVAQIAKSIAIRLNATSPRFRTKRLKIEPEIVEFAGLAHDLGHPPFGHNGEEALDECMHDVGGFEGNAQTMRILARLEKKSFQSLESLPTAHGNDRRAGLNLTFRSLASVLKYDNPIPERGADRKNVGVMKGYYASEHELVRAIKQNVVGDPDYNGFKSVECSIMDIADDIAYSTYDLEDIFKAGFLSPMRLFSLDDEIYEDVASTIRERVKRQYPEQSDIVEFIVGDEIKGVLYGIFSDMLFDVSEDDESNKVGTDDISKKKMLVAAEVHAASRKLASDGYHRVRFTSSLVQSFLEGVEVLPNPKLPQLHKVRLKFDTFIYVEVLKNITFHAIIRSPGMQVVEYRGKDIIKSIFNALADECHDGIRLLPDDVRALCKGADKVDRMRSICDFIAGMTDRYAFEFYGRLYGTNHLTVHKPL